MDCLTSSLGVSISGSCLGKETRTEETGTGGGVRGQV